MNVSVRKNLVTRLVAFMMAVTPIAATGVVVGGLSFGSLAFATPPAGGAGDTATVKGTNGTSDGLTNVQSTACNIANIIRGPVGIAIGFLVVVGGIIALQVASRDALPLIGRGVFGTALLLGASAAFGAIVSAPCTG